MLHSFLRNLGLILLPLQGSLPAKVKASWHTRRRQVLFSERLLQRKCLLKEGFESLFRVFQMKERTLNVKEVTALISLGTKRQTDAKALENALAPTSKEGISSYILDGVFKELSFPYFGLSFNQYGEFMGETIENTRSFEDTIALLAYPPRSSDSLDQVL
jgi:hypothetical protein